jgi:hypothetical protein
LLSAQAVRYRWGSSASVLTLRLFMVVDPRSARVRPRLSIVIAALIGMQALSANAVRAETAAAQGSLTRADYEACQSREEATFRQAIEAVTHSALKRSLSSFDYANAVSDAWRSRAMDEVIDTRVDKAVSEIGNERSWGELLQSLADSAKAQELALAVAERVYRSDAVKAGVESVAADVGRTLGLSLEFATQDAAEPAIACLKAFLGPRYGATVAAAVTSSAESEFGIDASKGKASVSSGAVISQSSQGITGAALILVRRQLANLAGRVSQRIVGSVLSRLVSVAAGGVGAVLIAKDIWELRAGVLPIIATEMKAKATKDLIKAELAKSIAEQIGEQLKDLSSKSAERMVEIWQEFRRAHAKSLEIADRDPKFRQFLDSVAPPRLPRVDEVVALILGTEGEGAILKRLTDGSLNQAVNKLGADAMTIARETRSLDGALKWSAMAGEALLPKVVAFELHKKTTADDLGKASLTRLLALDDRLAVSRLAALKSEARDTLFELDPANLTALARALSEQELSALSGYLTGLATKPRAQILAAVAKAPAKMKVLAIARVRDAVLASSDQAAAVDMMLRDGSGTATQIGDDLRAAIDGRISGWLILDRHPMILALSIVPLFVVLLLLRRIFMPRRRPHQHPSPPAPQA